MKVILRSTVAYLGEPGQVVSVKDGFARNWLIPQGLANPATGGTLRYLDSAKSARDKRQAHVVRQATAIAEAVVTIRKQVGENDRLFGTVTSMEIADELGKRGLEVDRRTIAISDPIKMLGSYTVTVRLHAQVQVPLKVEVVPA
jgi:large subunit ribosomal protein L9